MTKLALVLILIAAAPMAMAEDATNLGAFAGVGYSTVDVNNDGTANASRDPGTAFGASISTPMSNSMDVEIGVIRQQDLLHIPLMVRFGTEKLLTVGAGVFGETGVGQARDFVFGWNLTAGLNFEIADRVRAFAEGRYLQDFDSNSDDGGLLALAGMRFALN